MKKYPDRVNEIASDVIKDIDPKESEKYGIITIIMIIGLTLTFIRILQECNKDKKLNEEQQIQFLQNKAKEISKERTWLTKLRIRKVLRQHLGKEVYKHYRNIISNNILDLGNTLSKEDFKLLMEQLND